MSSADNSVARGQESSSASSAFVSPFSGFFRAPMPESLRVGAPGTFDHVLTRVDNHRPRHFSHLFLVVREQLSFPRQKNIFNNRRFVGFSLFTAFQQIVGSFGRHFFNVWH